jgi:hypothetical protein
MISQANCSSLGIQDKAPIRGLQNLEGNGPERCQPRALPIDRSKQGFTAS